jgi:hypothetical protein
MRRWLVGIVAAFVGTGAACGGSITVDVPGDAGVVEPVVTDASVDRQPPNGEAACKRPPAPTKCSTPGPAPTTREGIAALLEGIGEPIRCASGTTNLWDLRGLVDLYGENRIFMMGEVHGSNEIGIVSSLVFEELAQKGLVNVLGYELPMDFEAPIQRYVDTGSDPVGEQVVQSLAPNMFGAILTEAARNQVKAGKKIRIAAVDVPTTTTLPSAALRELAQKLTTQRGVVLDTLPTYASDAPTPDELARTRTYFDSIMAKKAEICAELTPADCDRLVAMTHALWVAAFAYDDATAQNAEWFARREEVIFYNMRQAMPKAEDRMYLHMGAFHTNKHSDSAGSRMAKEYPLTKGKVLSVAPAYGDGSVIRYGSDQRLPGEPRTLTRAFGDEPNQPLFVATNRPGQTSCETNPLGLEPDEEVIGTGTRGQLYDGYIHYGKLTSEGRPRDAVLTREDKVVGRALQAFRARIDRAESHAFDRRMKAHSVVRR